MIKIKKNYDMVDLLKFVFAILIVALHTQFLKSFSEYGNFFVTSIFSRIAVPYFFMISGFLLLKKVQLFGEEEKKIYIKKYIKRLGIMYAIWSLIYALFYIMADIFKNRLNIDSMILWLKNILFLNDGVLWYIQVLIVVVIIFYICYEKGWWKILLMVSLILYVLQVIGGTYNVFISNETTRLLLEKMNITLFKGLIFFNLGAHIAHQDKKIDTYKNMKLILFYLFFLTCEVSLFMSEDIIQLNNIRGYFFSLPLLTYYLVILSLNKTIKLKESAVYRNMSILIYFIHNIVMGITNKILIVLLGLDNTFILFMGTIIISITISLVIIKLSNKITLLNYLY